MARTYTLHELHSRGLMRPSKAEVDAAQVKAQQEYEAMIRSYYSPSAMPPHGRDSPHDRKSDEDVIDASFEEICEKPKLIEHQS